MAPMRELWGSERTGAKRASRSGSGGTGGVLLQHRSVPGMVLNGGSRLMGQAAHCRDAQPCTTCLFLPHLPTHPPTYARHAALTPPSHPSPPPRLARLHSRAYLDMARPVCREA